MGEVLRGPAARRRALPVLGAAALVLVAAVATSVLTPNSDEGHGSALVPAVAAPPGFAGVGSWSTGPLQPAAGPTVAVGDALAYVTADGHLTLADAATGTVRWRHPVGSRVQGHLAATQLVGTGALAIHANDHLQLWSIADGSPVASVALPEHAQVTYLGQSPLVGVGPSAVAVVGSGGLQELAVPPGAYPLAAFQDGTVTAASPAGWWHLHPGVAPGAAQPWEPPNPDALPADARPEVLGYLNRSVVLRYPAFLDRRPEVVVHSDDGRTLQVAFRGPSVPVAGASTVDTAPGATWGIVGRTMIDTARGAVDDLGDWSTTSLTPSRAYGTVGGETATAQPGESPVLVPDGGTAPETASAAGAVVRATGPAKDTGGDMVLSDGQEAAVLLPPIS